MNIFNFIKLYVSQKTTAAQNDDALSYHRVRGLCFQTVVFVATIYLLEVTLAFTRFLLEQYNSSNFSFTFSKYSE